MTYKGKVDWWIGLALIAGAALPAFNAVLMHRYWLAVPSAILIVLLLVCVYPQTYTTGGDALYIRAGLTKRTIPWPEITGVSATADGRGSLALSLDRILIQHASGEIMIAPDDQTRFFDDVASHCPQLSRRGMGLVTAFN